MELLELHGSRWDDEEVGRLRFPRLTAPASGTSCDVYDCSGCRTGSFRNKAYGSTLAVSAKAAIRVTGATFVDTMIAVTP